MDNAGDLRAVGALHGDTRESVWAQHHQGLRPGCAIRAPVHNAPLRWVRLEAVHERIPLSRCRAQCGRKLVTLRLFRLQGTTKVIQAGLVLKHKGHGLVVERALRALHSGVFER